MENSVRALYMGAGMLIAVLVIGLFVYTFTTAGDFAETYEQQKSTDEIYAFNSQFEIYQKETKQRGRTYAYSFEAKGNTASDVISCANLVHDINTKYDYDPDYAVTMVVDLHSGGLLFIDLNESIEKNKFKGTPAYMREFFEFLKYNNEARVVNINNSYYQSTNEIIYKYYFDVPEDGIKYSEKTGRVNYIQFERDATDAFDTTYYWKESQ